jgi:CRP/FNR family transcriptional regulator, cyclic AMP receptor protein
MAGPNGSKRLQKGDLIFKEGDSSNAMYLIRSGMIRIFKKKGDQQIEIDTLRSGQIVGEMAFLDGNPRSAGAEALMDTELVEISKSIYDSTMVQVPEWLKVLLKAIVARLRSTTTKMKNLESSSSEMNYADGRRNFIFLGVHDCLKISSAVLLVSNLVNEDLPEGKKIKMGSLERYANQVMGVPVAKVTSYLDILKQANIVHISENSQDVALKDPKLLESFIQYVCDENLLEPTKRHDISLRGFLVMGLISKHLDKFPKDETSGMSTVNVAEVQKLETPASGKEPFRMDEFVELVKVGHASNLTVIGTDQQTTMINVEPFKRAYRINRILKIIEAMNEEKQKNALGIRN